MSAGCMEENKKTGSAASAVALKVRRTVNELMGSAREMVIVHAGEEYRLRVTSKGKLILTK